MSANDLAFFKGTAGSMVRTYDISTYMRLGDKVELTTDASPWGEGGYLSINRVITSYFAEAVTEEEAKMLQACIGESAAQQAFEAFTVLIALRLWSDKWAVSATLLSRAEIDGIGTSAEIQQ